MAALLVEKYQHDWLQKDDSPQPQYDLQPQHKNPTVMVVEESPGAERSLESVLKQAFPNGSVIAVGCISESSVALAVRPVDIVVVDLDLPDGSGIEVIQECCRCSPSTRCVISTVHDGDEHIVPALAAGASGYLLKNQSERTLVQQLRLLAEGVPPLAPSVARRLLRHFSEQRGTTVGTNPASELPVSELPVGELPVSDPPNDPPSHPQQQDKLPMLSEREKQVLCLIAKGLQIAAVAQLLQISANTVCSHIRNIYRKRHLSSRAEAALEAHRLGLV